MSDYADSLDPFDPLNPFPEPVVIPITDVFDLHTIQPRDVKLVVEEYLQEACPLRFRSVRIPPRKVDTQGQDLARILQRLRQRGKGRDQSARLEIWLIELLPSHGEPPSHNTFFSLSFDSDIRRTKPLQLTAR